MPTAGQYEPVIANVTCTVTSGNTTSGEVDLAGCQLVGIYVPSTFDGTTITLTCAPTAGGTHVAVQDGYGSAFTLTTAASRYCPIPSLAITAGIEFVKLVCGTSQSTTDTVFTLAVRPV